MAKLKLETLSPVHVGSGVQFQGNAEYLYFEREKVLAIIDEAKVLDIIGTDNIHIWVTYIEDTSNRNNFLEYLLKRAPNLKPEDVATRVLPLRGRKAPLFSNTLREQIHGGQGKPYLPGSSIKGSVRTALLATHLMSAYEKGIPDHKLGVRTGDGKLLVKDKIIQSEYFGKDPNSDWLRMLQVGDCYFEEGTSAAFAETLNEKGNDRFEIKKEVRQLIEYIPAGREAEFQISVPEKHRDLILRKNSDLFNKRGVEKLDLKTLFNLINAHTIRLLEGEMSFFKESDLPDEAEFLQEFMQNMLSEVKKMKDDTCLLRLGFGTGLRNMTGDWVRFLVNDDDIFEEIATKTRRTSRYNHLRLPKSRKMMFDGKLMGFVKMTLKQ